ncbi:MAG: hypothetical protein ACOC9Q_03065, partial [bacterium]
MNTSLSGSRTGASGQPSTDRIIPLRWRPARLFVIFARLWVISAGLMLGPGSFKLTYLDAEMIDLANQSRGIVHASELTASMRIGGPGARAYLSAYPEPPQGWILTPNIELIYDRYERYHQGKEPLAMVAYLCHLDGACRDGAFREHGDQTAKGSC